MATLTHLDSLDISGSAVSPSSIVKSGDILYVGAKSTGGTLVTIDASDPSTLSVLDATDGGGTGQAVGVGVSGNDAVTADSNNRVARYDVTNPAATTLTSGSAQGTPADGVANATHFFTACTQVGRTLEVWTIAPLAHIASAGLGGPQGRAVHVDGSYAYVAVASSSGLGVWDISTPASPSNTDSDFPAGMDTPAGIDKSGDHVYVVGGADLTIFDVSNPASISVADASALATITAAVDVKVVSDVAFVLGTSELDVYDVSDPTTPSLLDSFNFTSWSTVTGVRLEVWLDGTDAILAICEQSGSTVHTYSYPLAAGGWSVGYVRIR